MEVLSAVCIVGPEPDQAAEALEDRGNDSIVREGAPDDQGRTVPVATDP